MFRTNTIFNRCSTVFLGCLLGMAVPTGAQKANSKPAEGQPNAPARGGKAAPQEKPTEVPKPHTNTSPFEVNGQITWIVQSLFKFHSPYQRDTGGQGGGSLLSRHETELSQTYTLYLGAQARPNLEVYLDPEMARGHGVSNALGLAGYTNGEVIRNPTLSQDPYLARYFVRWNIPTGKGTEAVAAAQNQVATIRPTHRLVVTAGKYGVSDIFDLNSYANNTRTQFMNWALLNNGAYDYAADTRGYTRGVVVEWVNPTWALRIGSYQMPVVANGIDLAGNVAHNRGDQIELELHPNLMRKLPLAIVRLLAYRNLAHMGNYREAIALGQKAGTTPDITKAAHVGNIKYGFGLNFEMPLGDVDEVGTGQTGLFGRYGWDDGATESFAYTEIDRTVQLGGQVSGRRWHRPHDRFALAWCRTTCAARTRTIWRREAQGSCWETAGSIMVRSILWRATITTRPPLSWHSHWTISASPTPAITRIEARPRLFLCARTWSSKG